MVLGTSRGRVPEDKTQYETDAERSENRFHRILAHVILAVISKRAHAIFCFVQRLAVFFSIILRHSQRRRLQIFRCAPCLLFAVRPFILRAAFTRATLNHIFGTHFFLSVLVCRTDKETNYSPPAIGQCSDSLIGKSPNALEETVTHTTLIFTRDFLELQKRVQYAVQGHSADRTNKSLLVYDQKQIVTNDYELTKKISGTN